MPLILLVSTVPSFPSQKRCPIPRKKPLSVSQVLRQHYGGSFALMSGLRWFTAFQTFNSTDCNGSKIPVSPAGLKGLFTVLSRHSISCVECRVSARNFPFSDK
jgi:hypothetical protein